MTDTNDTKRPAKTLSRKKTEMSTVKQSFSHGRTKAVVVEKKRTLGPTPPPATTIKAPENKSAPVQTRPAATSQTAAPAPRGVVLRQLTEEEKARRGAALADARVYEEEARKRAEEDAKVRAVEDARLKIGR